MDSYGCGDNAVIGAVTGQLRQHLIHENASQTFLRKNVCIFWLHVPVNECFFFRCQPHETKLLVSEGTPDQPHLPNRGAGSAGNTR